MKTILAAVITLFATAAFAQAPAAPAAGGGEKTTQEMKAPGKAGDMKAAAAEKEEHCKPGDKKCHGKHKKGEKHKHE